MEALRRYETGRGCVTLRPETAADEPFLKALFRSHAELPLRAAGLSDSAIDTMVEIQYRSQTATYRTLYPHADRWIVESEGEPIGRLIEHDEGENIYIVDVALVPEHQSKGLGTALIGLVANEWAAKGKGMRAEVRIGNTASLKLFARLGFRQVGDSSMGSVNLLRPLAMTRANLAAVDNA